MSEAVAENAAILPATKDGEKKVIESPKSIKLSRAQSVSFNALNADEQRINQRLQHLNQEINQGIAVLKETQDARAEILNEIEAAQNLESGTLSSYQYNGKELVKPI
jgi:hypothetical protein